MSVSCKLVGGLSNNLFIMAATLSHSFKHSVPCFIPTTIDNPHYTDQKVYYSPFINYSDELPKGIKCFYNEPFFHYQEIPKSDCDCLVLNGYFQSWKYSNGYLPEIRKAFNFNYETKKGIVGVHIRRTNYLKLPNHHPVVTMDYLSKAIYLMHIKGYDKFLIHSDDLVWAKENLLQSSLSFIVDFEFSENKNELQDFESLMNCEHQIISNSSFGLMAAMLNINPDKICIAPEKWFGDSLKHDTTDLYLPGTIII